jgi:imidazole glycerol-phosphate synthase subunit HisH
MIAIVDYGLGNIRAFENVYNNLNIPVIIARLPEHLLKADKIILPGVGSFDYAMKQLSDSGMLDILNELVLERKIPVMGICVGMQMLAKSSEEGKIPGLGWLDAEVKRFRLSTFVNAACIPHMGWNDIKPAKTHNLLKNLEHDARFYFLHSYYFHCNRKENILATTDYGINFISAVNQNNISGVQFHPEKSHQWGIQLLKNFSDL